jgi:hypothetical protein
MTTTLQVCGGWRSLEEKTSKVYAMACAYDNNLAGLRWEEKLGVKG